MNDSTRSVKASFEDDCLQITVSEDSACTIRGHILGRKRHESSSFVYINRKELDEIIGQVASVAHIEQIMMAKRVDGRFMEMGADLYNQWANMAGGAMWKELTNESRMWWAQLARQLK